MHDWKNIKSREGFTVCSTFQCRGAYLSAGPTFRCKDYSSKHRFETLMHPDAYEAKKLHI